MGTDLLKDTVVITYLSEPETYKLQQAVYLSINFARSIHPTRCDAASVPPIRVSLNVVSSSSFQHHVI